MSRITADVSIGDCSRMTQLTVKTDEVQQAVTAQGLTANGPPGPSEWANDLCWPIFRSDRGGVA